MKTIEFDGTNIEVHRGSDDGILVIDISTEKSTNPVDHFDTGVPKIRIWLNGECTETRPDGSWVNLDLAGNVITS